MNLNDVVTLCVAIALSYCVYGRCEGTVGENPTRPISWTTEFV